MSLSIPHLRGTAAGAFFLCFMLSCNGPRPTTDSGGDDEGPLSCSLEDLASGSGSGCGCDLALPVDPATLQGAEKIWPFGVHGNYGHKEGHRGLDFISTATTTVYAPGNGTVTRLERTSQLDEEYVAEGKVLYMILECGIQVSFQPVIPKDGLAVGSVVTKGEAIGTLAELIPPYGPNRFSTHFDTTVAASDSAEAVQCPGHFYSETLRSELQDLVDASPYEEKVARNPPAYTCKDGSTPSYSIPAQPLLCNPRASAQLKADITACVEPVIEVW